jgi:hypothetical protein
VRERRARPRFVVVALATAGTLAGTVAPQLGASPHTLVLPHATHVDDALPAHTARVVSTRALRQTTKGWETHTTASVAVSVSPSYEDAEEAARRWAGFVLGLIHGEELDGLTLYLGTVGEVAAICGIDASGCYGSPSSDIVSVGDASTGVRPEAIVAHEYGHYVAAHRNNAPWNALDWGTKRWATHVGVCAGVRAKKLFPADQLLKYMFNPGEGFAEAYRVLNAQPIGDGSTMDWPIVHRLFYPDAKALAAIRKDVTSPWAAPTEVRVAGRLGAGGRARVAVRTPLDGTLEVAATGATIRGSHALRTTVCGTRSTKLELVGRARARFVLNVTRP